MSDRTYRIRQIPSSINSGRLPDFLAACLTDISKNEVSIFSLAPSLNSWEDPRTQVATVCFTKIPANLNTTANEWTLTVPTLGTTLICDTHFLDFTPLNSVDDRDHVLSCIAIPGLAGHPFGSWKQRTQHTSTFMWLRDWIPKIQGIRVYTFGYDTRLPQSQSVQTTDDIALALVTKLKTFGFLDGKPLIFLAHSLGGIVLKRAILTMAEDASMKPLLDLVTATFLFGVPNKGMTMSHLLPMVDGYPNETLIRSLAPNSELLVRLDEGFTAVVIAQAIKVISAYETEKSLTMEQAPSGKWTVTGPPEYLVDKSSAIQASSCDDFPINKNHSDMVKFGPDDANCGIVMDRIAKLKMKLSRRNLGGGSQITASSSLVPSTQSIPISNSESSTQSWARVGFPGLERLSPDELKQACIHSLKFRTQRHRQEDILPSHADTCDWLFRTYQWRQWLGRDQVQTFNGVLWIKGNPGSGKSTLMKHALLYCQSNLQENHIAAYFFHARGDTLEKSFLGMLRSLLSQILEHNEPIYRAFEQLFREQIQENADFHWTIPRLRNFFIAQIQHRRTGPLMLFIDALDECSEAEVRNVVSFLEDLGSVAVSRKVELLICLSSRHYPTIGMKRNLELILENQSEHFEDITVYIRDRLRVADKSIEEELLRKASGIFMWVVLVTEMLNEAYDRGDIPAVHEKLENVPEGLGKLFRDLLQDMTNETVLMFQWVLFAKWPLSIDELYYGVKLGSNPSAIKEWEKFHIAPRDKQRFIISCSRGLVEVRNSSGRVELSGAMSLSKEREAEKSEERAPEKPGTLPRPERVRDRLKSWFRKNKASPAKARPVSTSLASQDKPKTTTQDDSQNYNSYVSGTVQFIHQSVKDFLTENDRLRELCPDMSDNFYGESHGALARCCLNRMKALAKPDPDSKTLPVTGMELPFLRYACASIIYHLELAQQEGFEQRKLASELFLDPNMFHFFKVLCSRMDISHSFYNADGIADAGPVYVASTFQAVSVLELLISLGADPNERGGRYDFALQAQMATFDPSEALARALIRAGADVNSVGGLYGTALQAAASTQTTAMAKILLAADANPNIKCGKYGSALAAAKDRGRPNMEELLQNASAKWEAKHAES